MDMLKIHFLLIAVALCYRINEVESTNTFQCLTSCLCISGHAGYSQIRNILEDQVVSDAWNRFQKVTAVDSTVVYLCRNAGLKRIEEQMMVTANALFLDGNNIQSLDTIGNGSVDNTSYPTMMLSLFKNKIKTIPVSFLERMASVRLLILRDNLLESLRWTKGPLLFPELLELDVSKNTLTNLTHEDVGDFPTLKRLDLSINTIRFVDGRALKKFPRLEYLDLSSNHITQQSFSAHLPQLTSLKILSLSSNAIDSIEDTALVNFFHAISSLQSLDLSRNRISSKTIPFEAFSAFQDLRKLNLSLCNIKYFAEGWLNGGPNATLKVLDISRNQLTSISAKYLSILDENNQEKDYDQGNDDNLAARSRLAIEVLYLNGNRMLSKIEDKAFEYMPDIRLLFLQNCNLQRFAIISPENKRQQISSSLPAMTSIWIFGNPIACDCYLRPLLIWSTATVQSTQNQTQQMHVIDPSYYKLESEKDKMMVKAGIAVCSSPKKFSGMAVEVVPVESMTCVDDTYSIVIALVIGPLSFAGAVILVIFCGSLHVLASKMRNNEMTIYYPKPEPPIRQQKWHDPPSHTKTRSGWYGDVTSTSIGQHGGMYTNLVMGQIACRTRQRDDRTDGIPSATSRAAQEEPRHRRRPTRSLADDGNSARRESDGPGGDVSDCQRKRFSSTDSSSLHNVQVDSRTDDTQL